MILSNKQEIELAQQYGVARSTVQEIARAFDDLTPLTYALFLVADGELVDVAIARSQEVPF